MQYYGAYYHSALLPLLRRINACLMRWLRKKYNGWHPPRKPGLLETRHCSVLPGSSPTGHWAWVPYSWWSLDFRGLSSDAFGVFPGQPDGVDFFGFWLVEAVA